MENVKNAVNTVKYGAMKNSPTIMLVGGIACALASTVFACIATLKAKKVVEKRNAKLEAIDETLEKASDETSGITYTAENAKADHTKANVKMAFSMAKLYAPSAVLMTASIALLCGGHNIAKKRFASLGAAYASLKTAFDGYRKKIGETIGDEAEEDIYNGVETVEETVETVDEKTGKTKTRVEKVKRKTAPGYSPYAKLFDEYNPNWEKSSEENQYFLMKTEHYANILLKSKGVLFLNDVYDLLSIPKTCAGQIVGWRYDPHSKNSDSKVDFGLCNATEFMRGHERSVMLDFNVDGPLFDRNGDLHSNLETGDLPNE